MAKLHRTILFSAILGASWLATVGFGMRVLHDQENKTGRIATVPQKFPAQSALQLAKNRPTLIMVAHPRSVSTRASLDELARVMAEARGKLKAYVVFNAAEGAGSDWNDPTLWQSASAIPDVVPVGDADGYEGRRFGAQTAGHALLFAADGRLLFSGGITTARAQDGEHTGQSQIASLVHDQPNAETTTPAFRSALIDRSPAEGRAVCQR